MSQKEAAKSMSLSKIQMIRIKKAYKKLGVLGLISKRRGRPSPNKINIDIIFFTPITKKKVGAHAPYLGRNIDLFL